MARIHLATFDLLLVFRDFRADPVKDGGCKSAESAVKQRRRVKCGATFAAFCKKTVVFEVI